MSVAPKSVAITACTCDLGRRHGAAQGTTRMRRTANAHVKKSGRTGLVKDFAEVLADAPILYIGYHQADDLISR